jgi:uncharacterized membrane protein YdcZ (DUF606 family)
MSARAKKRHPVWAAISGFCSGLFIGTSLLLLGVVPLDSIVLTVLPIAGLVLGIVLTLLKRPAAPPTVASASPAATAAAEPGTAGDPEPASTD